MPRKRAIVLYTEDCRLYKFVDAWNSNGKLELLKQYSGLKESDDLQLINSRWQHSGLNKNFNQWERLSNLILT